MKKVVILLAVAAMISTGACTSFSGRTQWKTDVDTMSYYFGLSRSENIMDYLVFQAGIDTNYMDAFYKGFKDGAKHYDPKEVAYLEGKRIAQLINNQWIEGLNRDIFMGDSGMTVNRKAVLQGYYSGMKMGKNAQIMNAQTWAHVKMEEIKTRYRNTKYGALIAAGEKILADNKNNPNVITAENGLQYQIITQGTGPIPDDKSKVKVNYRGTLADGTEFDSSYKNDAPTTFYVNGVISGWSQALKMMPVGSKWKLYIPYSLAYGAEGSLPKVPPYSMLIFEVELVEIEN